jgi:hypothetical protein
MCPREGYTERTYLVRNSPNESVRNTFEDGARRKRVKFYGGLSVVALEVSKCEFCTIGAGVIWEMRKVLNNALIRVGVPT